MHAREVFREIIAQISYIAEGILDNNTTSLIHDVNDEIDDMEEINDAIPVNEEKLQQV